MNKQATKQAIVEAVADLLRHGSGTALTATQIAEAAGISRRTLFNYFPSVDAVYSYPLHQVLGTMVDSISDLSDSMPLVEAIIEALKSDDVARLLGQVAHFGAFLRTEGANCGFPAMMNEWQTAATEVIEKVARRYPHANTFTVRVFTHALLGAGQAAFDEWIERLPATETVGMDISPELISVFHSLITQAMETLDEGFKALPLSSTSTVKDI
nr:TetR family transcriptional regulator [Glutamicibacter nicotianae]